MKVKRLISLTFERSDVLKIIEDSGSVPDGYIVQELSIQTNYGGASGGWGVTFCVVEKEEGD